MSFDFDVIVIGGGAAGLTAAGLAAHLGARTLLIESNRLGGDCTWTGCVPSKTLLHAASVAETIRTADTYGISAGEQRVDFARVMALVRSTREAVYVERDKPEVIEQMGVDIRRGRGRFVDSHSVEIEPVGAAIPQLSTGRSSVAHEDTAATESAGRAERVTGRFIIICTGATPAVPPIPGLDSTPYLTSESLFELRDQPDHLVILGAGPVGTEMAQAFRRLGSDVTVIDEADRILTKDEPELSSLLKNRLESEGVRFLLGTSVNSVTGTAGAIRMDVNNGAVVDGTALLVATGKSPNVTGLDLESAEVAAFSGGIHVDARCRTGVKHIFAAGDVTGRHQLTHMSEHMAKTAVMNALLKIPSNIDDKHVPWVTFTDPELAHVGATEAELTKEGVRFEVHRFPYEEIDRAVVDDRIDGMIVVHATKWQGKILGASILGARAGELIGELGLAMRNGISLRQISDTIHAYPTYGLGVRRAADQWYVRRRSTRVVKTLKKVFGYDGPVIQSAPGEVR